MTRYGIEALDRNGGGSGVLFDPRRQEFISAYHKDAHQATFSTECGAVRAARFLRMMTQICMVEFA